MSGPFPRRLAGLLGVAVCSVALAQPPAEPAPMPRAVAAKPADTPAAALDRKVLAEVKDRSQIMANLAHLSDSIGSRLTGSPGLEAANKWTAAKFTEYGLEDVHLEPWEIPVGWTRGTATMTMVSPTPGRQLLVASRGWSPGTKGKVSGPVVVADIRTKADLAKYKGKLKNAIILRGKPADVAPVTDMNYGPGAKKDAPKADAPKGDAPRIDGEPKKDAPKKGDTPPSAADPVRRFEDIQAFRREVDDFLRAEGAAATVSDSGKPHGLLVTTGGWREGDRGTQQEPLPGLFMAHEHYLTLHRLATDPKGKPAEVTLEITNTFVPGPITVFNTVADVKGATKPDEVIVIGAHLDSWDLATGTTDNGTGSSVVLEVARVVAKLAKEGQRPARTIRFVLFSGEEQGLYGSKRYCEKHKAEMPNHSMALVHDTGTGKVRGFGVQGRADVLKVLEPELETLKTVDGWEGINLRSSGGTDHLSFESLGVPGFACWQQMDEYRLTHHTQSDTLDKAKEPNLVQGAQVIAVTAIRVANLPAVLPRTRPEPKGKGLRGAKDAKPAEPAKP